MRSVFRHTGVIWRMTAHCVVFAGLIAMVIGCDTIGGVFDEDGPGGTPITEGFFGGVVGDDPRAVLAARTILTNGGTAADAAAAYYFMSAVSLPATSSLGAGGVCMVYDKGQNQTQLLDFRNGMAGGSMAPGARAIGLPGAVRGMFAIYARFGKLSWTDVVAPAERAARFGIPVSRGLASDLALVGAALMEDPAARAIFGGPDGQVLGEGDTLVQRDLAGMLSYIRTRGAGDFYSGLSATQFIEGVAATGVTLPSANLRGFVPHWREPALRALPWTILGSESETKVPGAGFDGGPIMLWSWDMLDGGARLAQATAPDLRAHLIAEVALRDAVARGLMADELPEPDDGAALMATYDPAAATPLSMLPGPPVVLQESPAASGFVVVDAYGNAVSCATTMNNLFGNGRVAPGTGIVLAAEPGPVRGNGMSLLPVLTVNENAREVIFAGVVTGGVLSGPLMASVVSDILANDVSLADAIAAPRVFHPGDPDVVVVEPEVGDAVVQGLLARGHDVRTVPELGLIQGISCPDGLRNGSGSCRFVTDPRGFGLGVGG
jgi:gamma-glutamyltranspeptidase / glutathione hydrolase